MEWIKRYFADLFSSDATLGLNPYDPDSNLRERNDGNDWVITVTQSEADVHCPRCGSLLVEEDQLHYPYLCEECDENFYEFETDIPTYEIRIRRIK